MLPCTDLTLEQRFQLDHSGLDSLISMRLVLRVPLTLVAPLGGQVDERQQEYPLSSSF